MISMKALKRLLETSLSDNNYDKFLNQLNDLEIDKDNFWNVIAVVEEVMKDKCSGETIEKDASFFDDLEDFKIKISNLFKNKLSNYKDDSLEDIYNKLDDFEGRLI